MYGEDVTERPREIGDRPMMEESRPTGNGGELTKEYIPNKQQILREYTIELRFLSVGCVVRVGCKEIPFTNVSEAMVELNKYVSNPHEEGKRWNKIFDSAE
jgi:hypothetical protein